MGIGWAQTILAEGVHPCHPPRGWMEFWQGECHILVVWVEKHEKVRVTNCLSVLVPPLR
jgi:hypothetical protein